MSGTRYDVTSMATNNTVPDIMETTMPTTSLSFQVGHNSGAVTVAIAIPVKNATA